MSKFKKIITRRSVLSFVLMFVSIVMSAQIKVSGVVKDDAGEPMPGVSVMIKGTNVGVVTDVNGLFSLQTDRKNAVLSFSFLGYTTQEQKLQTGKLMTVTMQEDHQVLDEVVVVGYQEVRKRDLTGSVSKADVSALTSTPVSSFDQTLGGRLAGVNVSSNEGMPGGSMKIVIRGNNSLTQENSPLYVIDGFPVEDPSIASSINPSDIASIDVLKDASASAIYGARGANGVVIIVTKSGKTGRPKVNYDGSVGWQSVSKTIPMMNAYEFVALQNEMYPEIVKNSYLSLYDGKQWTMDDYKHIPQYDWQDMIFRTAPIQNHNVSLTGGSEDVRYTASLSYFDQDGIVQNSNYNRIQGTYMQFNGFVEYELMKGLRLKVSGGYTDNRMNTDNFNNSKTRYGGPTSIEKVNAQVARAQRQTWLNENTLTWQTNIQKRHYFNSLLGFSLQNSDFEYYRFKTIKIPNESLGMAGMSDGTPTITRSEKSSWAMMSYFGRFNYNYKSKYYATMTMRADGSSKFRGNNRFGYFPSGSLAWNFTEEQFMKPVHKVLNSGKLRLSWGLTGNNRVGEYDTYGIYQLLKDRTGDLISLESVPSGVYPYNNDNTNVGMVPVSIPNKDLKWETTEQWNLGVDLGFLNDRIGLTVDLYHKVTRDLLLVSSLPLSSGFISAMKNVGKVRNQGLEITLNTTNIKTKHFTWTSNFNIAFNRNKVLALSENQTALLTSAQFDQNFNSQSSYIAKVGHSMGAMYGYIYEGTYKLDDFNKSGNSYTLKSNVPYYTSEANTQPGMPKYRDLNDDGVINTNDCTFIGNGLPTHTGGFTNNFNYRDFDFSFFFQWSYGNDVLNANRLMFESSWNRTRELNQFASYADRWTIDNPTSNIPRATSSSSNRVFSSRIIEDGSFLRLKTLTLGYTVPRKAISRVGIDQLRIYFAAQNLFTISNYSGYDPEVSIRESALTPGLDFSAYPRARSFSFGINLGF